MVKGPCRGKRCDFWARIKLKKRSIDTLAEDLGEKIQTCDSDKGRRLEEAFKAYWSQIGIRDMKRLSQEEPDLYSKIREVEDTVASSN
ncbi:hypothetical protein EU538_01065 [Candidatus Thorarchaeota archaeon]|nr:MAG: hypothetical protein EU538_01065 [Candidatus Thorarchaeota archaeon]